MMHARPVDHDRWSPSATSGFLIRHPGSNHAYFSAPGGQVFRVLDVPFKGSVAANAFSATDLVTCLRCLATCE
jgi:hypothetical protein